jgi:hypothetical protein
MNERIGGPLGGFEIIRQTLVRLSHQPIGLKTYFTDDTRTEEAAAELHLGYTESGEACHAYLIYHCGAYYDTHGDVKLLSMLGCDPAIAGKSYCESLGYDVEHATWGEDDEIPEDSFCYQHAMDRRKAGDSQSRSILIPEQWGW